MPRFKSLTDFVYHNSAQDKTVGFDPVQMDKDGWTEAQVAAGLIEEIVEEKPAKAKKEATE